MNETNVNYLLVTSNLRKLFSFAVATQQHRKNYLKDTTPFM